jgi:adenylate cyclase
MKDVTRLAAYVPVTLARQILRQGLPAPGQPRQLTAATLFADISGFTAMSEELALDGPRGAEEVNRVLLLTFTGMIDLIHRFGGAISHFYGDAMAVYFPEEDDPSGDGSDGGGTAARRALACAHQMQQMMLTDLGRVETNRPAGRNPFFDLTIKIGLSYGDCQEMVVGDPSRALEFVLAGTAVEEAAAAEHEAKSGQLVIQPALERQLAQSPAARPDQFDHAPLLQWDEYDDDARQRLRTAVIPFIPQAVHERIVATQSDNLAEHRPVSSLFVQFELDGSAAVAAERLQDYFMWATEVVGRFGSRNARLNRILTGDKGNQLHIIFGAPVAPDAPDQAILCALALQKEQPDYVRFQRIGLAAGRVFAGPVGSANRREYTVVGDVVNISARLMQVCAVGDVITDEPTVQRAGELIAFEERPSVRLRGKQLPIKLFRARRQQATTTQLQAHYGRWQRPLVGRDEELAWLRQQLDKVREENGRSLLVYGPTGVGKSRLVAAGVTHWLAAGGRGLVGVCQPHMADTPYAPWRDIWFELLGLSGSMTAPEQAAAVADWTRSLVPDVGPDVGLWAEVLGLPLEEDSYLAGLTAQVRQARFFALVRRCLQALTDRQPVLIILEDIHWADQSTLALVEVLNQHLGMMPLCLLITSREPAADLSLSLDQLENPATSMTLKDLSAAHARQVLTQLLGTADLPRVVEQHLGLRDREGRESPVNPLFLEEALRVMMSLKILQVNGRVQVDEARLRQMQLPDTIHGMLLARLDRLPAAGRHLLQVASVIGRQFAREPLSQMVPDLPSAAVSDLLADLSQEEITQLVTADPEWVYLFQHAMTHEVAYESLPFARRQSLHAGVADWLATRYADNLKPLYPVLAYHYDRANLHQPALEYALAAAAAARDIFANREAVELYTLAEKHLKVLGEAERWETAVSIYLEQGKCLCLLGDFHKATASLTTAQKIAQTHRHHAWLALACNRLAEVKYRQSSFEEAIELTTGVITETAVVPAGELSLALLWRGLSAISLQNYEAALTDLKQAEALCQQGQNLALLARVWEGMAFAYYSQRDLENALAMMQKSVQLSRDYSTSANIASALNNIALIQFSLGRPLEASETLNEAILLVADVSNNFLAQALANKAEMAAYLGAFDEAQIYFQEAMNLFRAMDDESGLIEVHLLWGYEYHLALGHLAAAADHFQQAQALIDRRPEYHLQETVRLLVGQAQLSLRSGALADVAAQLEQANSLIAERELLWWQPAVCHIAGEYYRQQGNLEKARTVWQKGLASIETNYGCPDYLPLLLLGLARLTAAGEARDNLLLDCLKAAEARSRYSDRTACYREAGELLCQSDDANVRAVGKSYLAQVEQTI